MRIHQAQSLKRWKSPADGYPRELGVYFLKQGAYIEIEPEILSVRTTNSLATGFGYGIKAMKINGWIAGKHSKNTLGSETRPFFLDIPEGVSPNEYTLLKFHEKGDRREVELGRALFDEDGYGTFGFAI
jgi:hypothetical protein